MIEQEPTLENKKEGIIGGKSFTKREMDTISCIYNHKATKKIAQMLDLSPRTIEGYIANILRKTGYSSQEQLNDFIIKYNYSDQINFHYFDILKEQSLRGRLRDISKSASKMQKNLQISGGDACLYKISKFLKYTGIKIVQNYSGDDAYLIYSDKDEKAQQNRNNPGRTIYVAIGKQIESFHIADFSDTEEFASLIFKISKILYPELDTKSYSDDYEKYVAEISCLKAQPLQFEEINHDSNQQSKYNIAQYPIILISIFFGCSFLVAGIIFFVSFYYSQTPKKHNSLIIPNKQVFLERNDYLDKIKESFKHKKRLQTAIILGPPGSGKTIMARHYGNISNYNFIWEINSETIETVKTSLIELGFFLADTNDEVSAMINYRSIGIESMTKKIISFIHHKLKSKSKWLIIFDNLESFENIKDFLPFENFSYGHGDIIITSRNADLVNNNFTDQNNIIGIRELNEDEQLKLFSDIALENSNLEYNLDEVKKFIKYIPPFPLDTVIASYYIKNTGISPQDYIQYLDNSNILPRRTNIFIGYDADINTRRNIIHSSINKIISSNNDFKKLMLLLSLVDSQNIPTSLFKIISKKDIADLFIAQLRENGLLTDEQIINDSKNISIHRTTQSILLRYFVEEIRQQPDEYKELHDITDLVKNHVDSIITGVDVPKILHVLNHYDVFIHNLKKFDSKIRSSTFIQLAQLYQYIGEFIRAKEVLEEIVSTTSNANDMDSILSNIQLGTIYRYLGMYNESANALEKGLLCLKKYYPQNYEKIVETYVQLGVTYKKLGNYEKSYFFIEKGVEISTNIFSEKHQSSLWANIQFAALNRRIGNYSIAKEILEKSIDLYINHLSYKSDHPNVIWSKSLLGLVYDDLGDYKKAKILIDQSMSQIQRLYKINLNGPKLIWPIIELTLIETRLGNSKKSIEYLKKTLVTLKQKYGEDHVEVAKVLYYTSRSYNEINELELADEFARKASSIYRNNNHPILYKSLCLEAEIAEKNYRNKKNSWLYNSTKITEAFRSAALLNYQEALLIAQKNMINQSIITNIQNKIEVLRKL